MGRGGRLFPRKGKEGESAGRYWVRLLSPFFAKEANLTLRREGGRLRVGLQQARGPSSSSSPFPLRVIGGDGGSTGQKKGLSGWADVCEFLAAWAHPPAAAAASKKKGGREGGIGRSENGASCLAFL